MFPCVKTHKTSAPESGLSAFLIFVPRRGKQHGCVQGRSCLCLTWAWDGHLLYFVLKRRRFRGTSSLPLSRLVLILEVRRQETPSFDEAWSVRLKRQILAKGRTGGEPYGNGAAHSSVLDLEAFWVDVRKGARPLLRPLLSCSPVCRISF